MTTADLIDSIARNVTSDRVDRIQLREDVEALADKFVAVGLLNTAHSWHQLHDRIEALEALYEPPF